MNLIDKKKVKLVFASDPDCGVKLGFAAEFAAVLLRRSVANETVVARMKKVITGRPIGLFDYNH
jgi:hypothetical protein